MTASAADRYLRRALTIKSNANALCENIYESLLIIMQVIWFIKIAISYCTVEIQLFQFISVPSLKVRLEL